MDIFNGFLLVFSVVSIILYIYILTLLILHRKDSRFNGSFFSLFISLGFADIWSTVNLYLYAFFRYWGWIDYRPLFLNPTIGWFSRVWAYMFNNYILLNQYIGVFAIALNRYFSITYPKQNLWTNKVHRWALVCEWLVPLFAVSPWLTQDVNAVFVQVGAENDSSSYIYMSVKAANSNFRNAYYIIVWTVSGNVLTVVTGLLYAKMIAAILKYKKDNVLSPSDKSNIRLAMVGFVLFVSMALYAFLTTFATRVVGQKHLRELLALMRYTVSCVFSVANPWLLVMGSSDTRKQMAKSAGFYDDVTNATSGVSPRYKRSEQKSKSVQQF